MHLHTALHVSILNGVIIAPDYKNPTWHWPTSWIYNTVLLVQMQYNDRVGQSLNCNA